jgi:hypothetical protein
MNDEGAWIDAPPCSVAGEEAFVINIGDMLEVMTAGAFPATSHRVRKVQQERFFLPLFFACDYHTRIRPCRNANGSGDAGSAMANSPSASICIRRPSRLIPTSSARWKRASWRCLPMHSSLAVLVICPAQDAGWSLTHRPFSIPLFFSPAAHRRSPAP